MSQQNNAISGTVRRAAVSAATHRLKIQQLPFVGQEVEFADGRKYRYVSFASSGDVGVGIVVGYNPLSTAEKTNQPTAAVAIGERTFTVNSNGVDYFGAGAGIIAQNEMAGGYLNVTDDLGEGYSYKIKSNTAGTAAVDATITLEEGVVVALDATSDIQIVRNPFEEVVVGTASTLPIGVTVVPTTGSTDSEVQMAWVQTRGVGVIGVGAAVSVGDPLAPSTAGAVITKIDTTASDSLLQVGIALDECANGFVSAYIQIG